MSFLKRRSFAIFLAILTIGGILATMVQASFSDVPSTHPFAQGIAYVESRGIIDGYGDGTFKPDAAVNRAEFIKIVISAEFSPDALATCLNQNGNAEIFRDVPRDAWFSSYVCVAKTNLIVHGYADGSFAPEKPISFVEAAKIIAGTFGFATSTTKSLTWYQPFVEKLADLKAIPTTISTFEHLLTRGEMAEIIYRLKANVLSADTLTYEDIANAYKQQKLCGTVSFRSRGEIAFGDFLLTEDTGPVWHLRPEDGASSNTLSSRINRKTCISYIPAAFPEDVRNHIIHVVSAAAITDDLASQLNCALVPDAGICKAFVKKYFFDKSTGKCSNFGWGGCGGVVPFDSLEACQSSCEKGGVTPAANVKEFTLLAKSSGFEPATITVKKGDLVRLTITSVDVSQGFSLPTFNVNSELSPGQTVQVEFVADQVGTFTFFCALCGPAYTSNKGTLTVTE